MKNAILAILLANHVAAPQAQAIDTLAHLESKGTPSAVSPGATYHCLLQWDRQRYAKLIWFTGAKRRCPPLRDQLDFALAELSHPRFRCFWKAKTTASAFYILRRTFGLGLELC